MGGHQTPATQEGVLRHNAQHSSFVLAFCGGAPAARKSRPGAHWQLGAAHAAEGPSSSSSISISSRGGQAGSSAAPCSVQRYPRPVWGDGGGGDLLAKARLG